MIAYVRSVPDLVRVSVSQHIAYRAEFAIWILSSTVPLIMLALWDAVIENNTIAGFGSADIARYFAATLIVRQLTGAWIVWELNFLIRTGKLSPFLLRPLHPLWYAAIRMLIAMPMRLAVLVPLLLIMSVWRPEIISFPGFPELILFVFSVFLAWLMAFMAQAMFGLLSFWIDQSMGVFGVWFASWSLLSGYVAPLAMFPDWAQTALRWLPFRGMLAVPVELLGGFLTVEEALPDIAIQVGWVAIFALLTATLWKRGVKRYGAFGA